MNDTELLQVESFLEALQARPLGRILAVNMFESHAESLMSAEVLRAFLLDCAETMAARPGPLTTPEKVVDDVSMGRGVHGRSYVRHSASAEFVDGERLTTTMNTRTFWAHLLNDSYKTGGLPTLLPPAPSDSPTELEEYRFRLADVTTDSGWFRPDASLGRGGAFNCWITSDRFGASGPVSSEHRATRVRDELGLVTCVDGSALVSVSFAASDVQEMPACEVARPTFADRGNARFAIHHSSSRASAHAAVGWGSTVDLEQFEARSADVAGASERVTQSLPASSLRLSVDFLGIARGTRGEPHAIDNDDTFALFLERGRSPGDIRDAILTAIR